MSVAGTTILAFWINFAREIAKARSVAEQANNKADAAQKACLDLNIQLQAQTASFAIYREQIAREYISRDSMRELEDRLTGEIKGLGTRIDRFLERKLDRRSNPDN